MNAVVLLAAVVAKASMVVAQPAAQVISLPVVLIATVVPLALAGVVTWALGLRVPALPRIAAWAGLAVAVLTAASPLLVAADVPSGLALGAMHVVAGVAWFVGVGRTRVAAPSPAIARAAPGPRRS